MTTLKSETICTAIDGSIRVFCVDGNYKNERVEDSAKCICWHAALLFRLANLFWFLGRGGVGGGTKESCGKGVVIIDRERRWHQGSEGWGWGKRDVG